MTTAELIARYRGLIAYDLDSMLGSLPGPDDAPANAAYDAGIVGYLNEAAVELAKLARLTDPAVALAVTAGKGRYPLDDPAFAARILTPYAVVMGGSRFPNAAGNDYGLWTLNELTMRSPAWMSDPQGAPDKAVFLGDALLLHPTPSADGVAYVDARIAPPPLSAAAPDDSPRMPVELHPGIAAMAVYRSCLPYAQTAAQAQRLGAMLNEATALAGDVGRLNDAARLGNGSAVARGFPLRMAV